MDALGQLTGGVAHDFNNLLMMVAGHVQTIKKVVTSDPKLQRAAHAIELAAQRGAALTRQLLTFSRRQRVNPQAIDVGARIEVVKDVLTSGLGKSIRLAFNIAPNAWSVTVDTSEFEIALVNLIVNARDAMPKGGTVTVSATNVHIEDVPLKGDYVALSIEDTGVGIPDDVMSKVFDPFFTTKPVGKGTGAWVVASAWFCASGRWHGDSVQRARRGHVDHDVSASCNERCQQLMTKAYSAAKPVAHTGTVLLVEDNPDVASCQRRTSEPARVTPSAGCRMPQRRCRRSRATALTLCSAISSCRARWTDLVLRRCHQAETSGTAGPCWPPATARTAQNAPADLPILRKPYQIHELSRALSDLTRSYILIIDNPPRWPRRDFDCGFVQSQRRAQPAHAPRRSIAASPTFRPIRTPASTTKAEPGARRRDHPLASSTKLSIVHIAL